VGKVEVVSQTGLVKRQRWGMKGRAVPPNPPDKQQLGPTSPFGNPYPNSRELIKTSQAIQPALSFFHCHVTLYNPMSSHHPPT